MRTKTFAATAPKFAKLQGLAVAIQTGDIQATSKALYALQIDPAFSCVAWQTCFAKLADTFADANPRFSIFALGGNSKLPFVAFSTLPGVTCPGAGDCLNFCYSYRAWRYPAAFARQCQNAWLMIHAPQTIAAAFAAIAAKRPGGFDFRLNVDGDFAHVGDIHFWMQTIATVPHCRAYGYSKSFHALLGYAVGGDAWPANYMLNVSSGHNAARAVIDAVKRLPITRGEFVAVNIGHKPVHGSKATNAALRAAMPEKIFPCPGQCGACTGAGHACGLPAMRGRVIAIAVH